MHAIHIISVCVWLYEGNGGKMFAAVYVCDDVLFVTHLLIQLGKCNDIKEMIPLGK